MDRLVREAGRTIAKGSKSFAIAARLFDPPTRARALMLYAWCRHCDDVTDEQELGHGHVVREGTIAERVDGLREATLRALNGEPTGELPFAALARVAGETGMPRAYPFQLIDGFSMDAHAGRFRTIEDVLAYSYHVAGVVGVMMAIVMGVDPDDRATLERASDLGIAFQLNNIARDICEDSKRQRCYLPDEWLAEADIPPGEYPRPAFRGALAAVVARLLGEADRYAASARFGVPALPFRAAWAVLAAAEIYGAIGARVRALGPAAWDRRVTTSTARKLGCVARTRGQALRRARLWGDAPPREGLWTMPVLA